MCGRFTLTVTRELLADAFGVDDFLPWEPRFNLAPTQPVVAVRQGQDGREGVLLRWGLIPSWASDRKIGGRLITARADTVATKPAFRAAFKRRRCIVPASGYFEWQQTEGGKQPSYIHPEGGILPFAGLWESWEAPDGEIVESCCIITTEASAAVRHVHDRMPVVLRPEDYAPWLDPGLQEADRLLPLLRPFEAVAFYPVSTYVNNPRHQGARCVERLGA